MSNDRIFQELASKLGDPLADTPPPDDADPDFEYNETGELVYVGPDVTDQLTDSNDTGDRGRSSG